MNHDATHCADYNQFCPETCYRAVLTKALKIDDYNLPVSFACFRYTDICPLNSKESKTAG